MEITEVKIFLRENVEKNKKLKAYVTITFDDAFVVRDIKVIEGNKGLFVAMPSKKDKIACSSCRYKNVVRSKFCNQCGARIEEKPFTKEDYQNEHKDIAHPITSEARECIQQKVLEAYEAEAGEYIPTIEEDVVEENIPEAATEESAVEEPVVEESAVEEPVVEEPEISEEDIGSPIGDIGDVGAIDSDIDVDTDEKADVEEDTAEDTDVDEDISVEEESEEDKQE